MELHTWYGRSYGRGYKRLQEAMDDDKETKI